MLALLGFGLAWLLNVLNPVLHQAVDTPGMPDLGIDWRAAVFCCGSRLRGDIKRSPRKVRG